MNLSSLRNKILLALLFLSFALSLGYSFLYRIPPVVDAQAYDRIAVNLASGKGFREDITKSFTSDSAIVRAGPGYEFFLAGLYAIFGHHYEVIWLVQALLHAFTVWLVFLIACRIFPDAGERIGLIAAVLLGLSPDLIEISAMLMTETLYLFFIVLTLWLFVKVYQSEKEKLLTPILGVSTALTILTRPPIALFIPVILYWYLKQKHYSHSVVFLGVILIVMIPWTVRNFLVFHQFIPTTLVGDYNLWLGNTLTADGGQFSAAFNPLTTYAAQHGFAAVKSVATQEFFSFVIAHPLTFLKLCGIRFIRFFSLIRPMGFWFYQRGLRQLLFIGSSAMYIFILFVSGFSGLILSFRDRSPLVRYMIAFAIAAPLPLMLTVVESRYRFQIYPFLAIFSGYFLTFFSREKIWQRVGEGVLTSLIFISLIDAGTSWSAIISHLHTFL